LTKLPVVFLIAFIFLAGCTNKEEGKSQSQSTQATMNPVTTSQLTKTPNESSSGSTKNVSQGQTTTPFPRTYIKPSIGGIALGDTDSQVQNILQKPNETTHVYQHPYIEWRYNNGIEVIFHSQSITSEKPEGVWKIDITKSSKLRTDTNIGIGDSKDLILNTYKNAEIETANTGSNYQTINVSTSSYLFSFVLQDNKIVEIMLAENHQ
jgi:hypothetical protein